MDAEVKPFEDNSNVLEGPTAWGNPSGPLFNDFLLVGMSGTRITKDNLLMSAVEESLLVNDSYRIGKTVFPINLKIR